MRFDVAAYRHPRENIGRELTRWLELGSCDLTLRELQAVMALLGLRVRFEAETTTDSTAQTVATPLAEGL